jgi:MFS transporter, putative metabolite:H+ symporter
MSDPYPCAPQPTKDGLPGFCGKTSIYYQVDFSNEASLDNWFVELSLECVSKTRIGLIGSSMFMGWALSAVFLPRLSDIYGRKKIFIFSILLQSCAMSVMYFSHSLNLTTAMMFIFGMAAVGRTSISFLYLMELLPTNRQVLVGTILHVNNAAVGVFGCLYFWKISKNWLWLEIFAGLVGVMCIIGASIWVPESPKFLVSRK